MEFVPIKTGSFNFKKSDLLYNRILIGIDVGILITKIVFLHKDNEIQITDDNTDFVTLNQIYFESHHLENALTWTKKHASIPSDPNLSVHLTGFGAYNKEDLVSSIFGRRAEPVDKDLAVISGHKVAFDQIKPQRLIAPPVEVSLPGEIESKFLDMFKGVQTSNQADENASHNDSDLLCFPCIIYVVGSSTAFYYFDKDGKGELFTDNTIGGAAFLGLAKCLLDTNSYEEVIKLASVGHRENIDTQVKEMISGNIESPYGKVPPEMPVFSFGKCMDLNKGLDYFSKEDVAMSLVALFSHMIMIDCLQMCQMTQTWRVYCTGNIFQSDLFQREIMIGLLIFRFPMKLDILNFGFFSALGAMCSDNNKKDKYYRIK